MIFITRKEHFSASHKLENPSLSIERNAEIFGKCNNLHGHNYYMEVTLCGTPDEESGYVMDLKKLKAILLECIIKKVDHSFLNELDIFKDTIPTTENMTRVFWDILKDKINKDNVKLYSIKLYETEKNSVEYRGE
jgi:6-pyruvoyltetrahydropterin/6-carboxytetrahydropterin synthase